jgi:hypothetical protein
MNQIIGGVDTHESTHHAAAISSNGALLACRQFPATRAGYQQLSSWLVSHGTVLKGVPVVILPDPTDTTVRSATMRILSRPISR